MTDQNPTILTAANFPIVRKHNNHTITLRDDWRFTVDGPEFDSVGHSITFDSLSAAYREIDKRVEETTKIVPKNVNVSYSVLTDDGSLFEITGINRRTGYIIRCAERQKLYPDVPWIATALHERKILNEKLRALNKKLYKVEMESRLAYGVISADDYPRLIDQLRKNMKECTDLALEMAKEEDEKVEAN